MRHLEACCFCINLKIGCLAIGIGGIILTVLSLAVAYISSVSFSSLEKQLSQTLSRTFSCIYVMTWVIISTILITGVLQDKAGSVLSWLIVSVILLTCSLMSVFYEITCDFKDRNYLNGSTAILVSILLIMLFIYLWLVVYSYYQKLRKEDTSPRT